MEDLIIGLTGDRLTAVKAATVCKLHAYTPSGVVLRNEIGDRCVVELGAVRWLSKEQTWGLMHPDSFEGARDRLAELILRANRDAIREALMPDELAAFDDAWAKTHNAGLPG